MHKDDLETKSIRAEEICHRRSYQYPVNEAAAGVIRRIITAAFILEFTQVSIIKCTSLNAGKAGKKGEYWLRALAQYHRFCGGCYELS